MREYFMTSDTLLENEQYYIKGSMEDVGQKLYAPLFWLDTLPALPEDADQKVYKLDPYRKWQDATIDAQAERAKEAETALQASLVKQKAVEAELADSKAMADGYLQQLQQSTEALKAMQGLQALMVSNTDRLTDEEAKTLTAFIPGWRADAQKYIKGQVVLGVDDSKPYRVIADVTTAQGQNPEADAEHYALIE